MNRYAWLVIVVSVLWFFASSSWYVCKVKNICPQALISFFNKNSTQTTGFVNSSGPISFSWNSASPIINNNFDSAMQDIINRMGPLDTLLVIGKYFKGETGNDLAIRRASNVQKSTMFFIDSSRIKTKSEMDEYGNPNRKNVFNAIQFQVVTAGASYVEPTTQTTNNELAVKTEPKPLAASHLGGILFDKRTSRRIVSPESDNILMEALEELKQNGTYKMEVVGHTSSSGNNDADYQLGRNRAWVIKKYFWDNGIDPVRIQTDSKGCLEPQANIEMLERVEIKVIKP